MKYFTSCKTIGELKKEYRRLAMLNHPDHGGSTETMQEINNQYDIAYNCLKDFHNRQAETDSTGNTRPIHETPEEFREIIDALMKIPGLLIELCGSWIWVSGDTKNHKEELKLIPGLHWAPKKKMWYWRKEEDSSHNRSSWDMKKIREKYGSEKVSSSTKEDHGGQLSWVM